MKRKHSQCKPDAGVRLYAKKSAKGIELYAEASHPRRLSSKRFYAGLFGKTATEERWEEACALARAARARLIQQHERLYKLIPSRG